MKVDDLIDKLESARDLAQGTGRAVYVGYPHSVPGLSFGISPYPYADDVQVRVLPDGTAEFLCDCGCNVDYARVTAADQTRH